MVRKSESCSARKVTHLIANDLGIVTLCREQNELKFSLSDLHDTMNWSMQSIEWCAH